MFEKVRIIIAVIILLAVGLRTLSVLLVKRKILTSNLLSKTAIFGAFSIILYIVPIFQFKIPLFPSFLEFHLDEIPALIAGFAYGPISGILVIFIKTIAKLPLSSTACAGELADLIYSIMFVVPSSLIYKKKRNFKGALVSLFIGMVIQIITASFLTTFVMLDVYVFLYPFLTKQDILIMCQAINPNINNLTWAFLLMVCLPFNVLKDTMVIVVTLVLYKKTKRLMDKISIKKTRD